MVSEGIWNVAGVCCLSDDLLNATATWCLSHCQSQPNHRKTLKGRNHHCLAYGQWWHFFRRTKLAGSGSAMPGIQPPLQEDSQKLTINQGSNDPDVIDKVY